MNLLPQQVGVPYDIALLTKRFYEEKLFKNDNVGHLTITPLIDEDESIDSNTLYIIEAGVYDLDLQNDSRIDPIDKIAKEENFNEFIVDSTVPEYLKIPDQITENQSKIIPENLTKSTYKNMILINEVKDLFKPVVSVKAVQAEEYHGLSFHRKQNNLQGGISANHYGMSQYGTLGAIVKLQGNNDDHFLISNWHVFSNYSSEIGDPILHPSPRDNGRKNIDTVAHLVWSQLSQHSDVALAKIKKDIPHSLVSKCDFQISGQTKPTPNMSVKKCGRTTKLTYGKIVDLNFSSNVSHNEYPNESIHFKDQIKVEIKTDSGDSGSILVDEATNKAVGLIFAKEKKGNYCLANYLNFNTIVNPLMENGRSNIEHLNIIF
jgi:hypothetical protein